MGFLGTKIRPGWCTAGALKLGSVFSAARSPQYGSYAADGARYPAQKGQDLMPLTHRSVPFFFTPGPAFWGPGPAVKNRALRDADLFFIFHGSTLLRCAVIANVGAAVFGWGLPGPFCTRGLGAAAPRPMGGSSVCTGPPQLYDRGVYTSRKSQGQKLTCTAPPGGSGARNGHERPARCPQTASLHGRGRRGSGGCNGSRSPAVPGTSRRPPVWKSG